MARRLTTSPIACVSARSDLRNLRRAGVAENSSRTSTMVPGLSAAGPTSPLAPRSTTMACAGSGAVRARLHGQMRDRADRGQRLAAKAERADVEQIVVGELRGGVPLDGKREFVRRHAAAVVVDAQQRQAAGDGDHVDLRGAGVDGVLDQFLDDGRRPLDHLAGGDAIDGLRRELADRHAAIYAPIAAPSIAPLPCMPPAGEFAKVRQGDIHRLMLPVSQGAAPGEGGEHAAEHTRHRVKQDRQRLAVGAGDDAGIAEADQGAEAEPQRQRPPFAEYQHEGDRQPAEPEIAQARRRRAAGSRSDGRSGRSARGAVRARP